VSTSRLTGRQRLLVTALVGVTVSALTILGGFVAASMHSFRNPPLIPTFTVASLPPTPGPTLTPGQAPDIEDGVLSQVEAARLFYQIAHQVELLRDLSPRAQVPLSFVDDREMASQVREVQLSRNPELQLLPYELLGLLPEVPVRVRARQVAGFYVPEQDQLYIASDRQASSPDDQLLLVHAYAYALLDQNFDLESLDSRAKTTDARLAVQALVEGDATLISALYRYEDPGLTNWDSLAELISQAAQTSYGPEIDQVDAWQQIQRFPFWEGPLFAVTVYREGGWDLLNQAYTDPPRSTEQILHPERYLRDPDVPATVVVPSLHEVLGGGWNRILEDSMGELVAGLYLAAEVPEQTAWQAVDGWDGDTIVVWEHDDGRRILVWRSIWDSTSDATEYEHAMLSLVEQRFVPVRPIDPRGGLGGHWWQFEDGALYLHRMGRYVTFVQAPDAGVLGNVLESLP